MSVIPRMIFLSVIFTMYQYLFVINYSIIYSDVRAIILNLHSYNQANMVLNLIY